MDVFLIRHTSVTVAPGLCYGRMEVPLASSFTAEVASLCAWLPPFEYIYTSPAERCRRLAEQLPGQHVEFDDRLLELDFGDWEGRTWEDNDGPEARAWGNDFVDSCCPGGESYAQLAARVASWQRELPVTSGPLAVITHGGPVRALLATWLELPLAQSFRFAIDCGGVSLLQLEADRWTARFVNRHG